MSPDSLPPHNPEAEIRLIGAALLSAGSVDDAVPHVSPDDFYGDQNRAIWCAIANMRDFGSTIDVVTVSAQVATRARIEQAELIDTLEHFLERTPHAADSEYHAKIGFIRGKRAPLSH